MTQHDFNEIFEHYPELIAEMPEVFNSHQFILHLARQRYQETQALFQGEFDLGVKYR